jgi:hypothetical protein
MYPCCDIDKVQSQGETRPVDPELREALNQVVVDLRGGIQTLGTDLRGEVQSSATETRAYVDERIQASSTEMRRHFDVVGESLRSDIRAVVEGMVASREQTDRRIDEEARQRGGLEGRVVRLEVSVADLEDGRKPRRARRRPPP